MTCLSPSHVLARYDGQTGREGKRGSPYKCGGLEDISTDIAA